MTIDVQTDGPTAAALTMILAHGAGAPMDSPFMAFFAAGLAVAGMRVVRFEFPYMARRRVDGRKRPPDRAEILLASWREVIAATAPAEHLVIGGKSLGGRMASMVVDQCGVDGIVCLGYPFHPPGKPEATRIAHLATLRTPTLILQGERDPFGDREDVAAYPLAATIRLHWLADGDHSFKPRAASGRSERQNWDEALAAIIAFLGARQR
ncbi:alpha/beta family hydrolase [Defluviicoccus vanus]|uniref:Dienelactone hydrolase family protein n=1 Tax=Defluviicoccus vanus TaxID=111831 RepID=A0A7H1N045_9PROT|nr:alpha/beta family hydrolase [Defluviicoccus vanus]QNT69081.1 dienelactone hydrolase family protein [Defluviicoccus vanus]